jgi:hypothetical protein
LEKHNNLEAGRHPTNKHLYSPPARYCTYLDCSVRATRCSLLVHIRGLDQWPSRISLPWLGLDTKRKRRTGPSEPPVHSQLPCSPLTSRLSNLACLFIHSAHSRPPHPRLLGRFSLLLLTLTFLHSSRSFAPNPPSVFLCFALSVGRASSACLLPVHPNNLNCESASERDRSPLSLVCDWKSTNPAVVTTTRRPVPHR